jgi:hypothetical protein
MWRRAVAGRRLVPISGPRRAIAGRRLVPISGRRRGSSTGGRRRAAVAALAAAVLLPAAAAAQDSAAATERLDSGSTSVPHDRETTPRRTAATVAAAAEEGGESAMAWVVAAILGVAGAALTIAGLASARRDHGSPTPAGGAGDSRTRSRRRRALPPRAVAASRPAPPAAPVGVGGSPEFEECRVTLVADDGGDHHFRAEPSSRDGDPVARSPAFRARRASSVMESAAARDALQALVAGLLAAGWQVVGRDDDPWALRFRRRAGAGRPFERHPAGR